MASLGERDAERVGVRNGMSRFHVGRFKDEGAIGWHHVERQLVDDADCALGVLESLLALNDVQALTVGDERQQDDHLFPAGRPQHLPYAWSGGLAIQGTCATWC